MTKEQEQTEIERIGQVVADIITEQENSNRKLNNDSGVSLAIITKVRKPGDKDYQIRPFIRLLHSLDKRIEIVDIKGEGAK